MSILATKLYIPPPRPRAVSRPRLLEMLHEGLHRKLTLISAPAGFGKTTLLSEWTADRACPTAWLSLDEDDNNRTRFLSYLIAAIQTVAPNVGKGAMDALTSQPPPNDELLTALINEIVSLGDEFIIVLDDYHALGDMSTDESPDVNDAVLFLLEHLPPHIHLVIASREDPPLPLARLRARSQLTEVRASDMRFTSEEAAAFLSQVMGLELTADQVDALEHRTEGWIAGLQLAALSMQGRDDPQGFVQAFAGDNRYIVDYLVEEVLQRQPKHVRDFLLQTSILERLSGPLCDAVCHRAAGSVDAEGKMLAEEPGGSQAILEELERGNLFVVPLDDKRGWFRYHHLFRDVLRAHLQKEKPGQAPELHRRASVWYEQNGLRTGAVRHALLGEDFVRAAEQIELAWPEMDGTFQSSTWLAWRRALPGEVVANRPVLQAAHAWAFLNIGEMEKGEMRLQEAESLLQLPPSDLIVVDKERFRTLPGSIATAHAYRAQSLGNGIDTVRYCRRALDLLRPQDHVLRGPPAALLALTYWADGQLEDAAQALTDAMTEFEQAGHLAFAISGTFGLGDIRLAQGRLRSAVQAYERSLKLATGDETHTVRGASYLYVGLSELRMEQNNLQAAVELLAKGEALQDQPPLTNFLHRLHLAKARLMEIYGEYDEALALLDEAARHYVRTPIPDIRPIEAHKARLWLRQGKVDKALKWATQEELCDCHEVPYRREFELMTVARVLMAKRDYDSSDHAIVDVQALLSRLLQAAEDGNRMGSAIEILVLQALAQSAYGAESKALTSLERALAIGEPEGYVRVFVDEGQAMADLLDAAAGRSISPDYVRELLAAFAPTSPPRARATTEWAPDPTAQPQALVEPLSERELEVLQLVAQGLTNREIGDRLYLALNTVKGHNRRIFSKLQVKHRTEAVARGRELGIL